MTLTLAMIAGQPAKVLLVVITISLLALVTAARLTYSAASLERMLGWVPRGLGWMRVRYVQGVAQSPMTCVGNLTLPILSLLSSKAQGCKDF